VRNRARTWVETLMRHRYQAEFEYEIAMARLQAPRAGYSDHRVAALRVLRNRHRLEYGRLMDHAVRLVCDQEGVRDARLSKDPAVASVCPRCGAASGAACKAPSGSVVPAHLARRQLLDVTVEARTSVAAGR
jgi:hypothetical protein